MTKLRCARVRTLLPLFVGSDLCADVPAEAQQLLALREHLRECGGCRREAADLQQSNKALRASFAAARPRVEESSFTTMHASIMAAVQTDAALRERGHRAAWRRPWLFASAAALFLAGVWFVRAPGGLTLMRRAPIATPIGSDAAVRAVPWAGPRVELEPLGEESWTYGAAESGFGAGMMGRGRLRALVEEDMLPPASADPLPEPGQPTKPAKPKPAKAPQTDRR